MAYKINGRRMTGSDAAWHLACLAAGTDGTEAAAFLETIWDFLFTIKPGTRREYARLTIACYYVD
jgi:hypothetical protein